MPPAPHIVASEQGSEAPCDPPPAGRDSTRKARGFKGIWVLAALLLLAGSPIAATTEPTLEVDRSISADGVYQLSWTLDGVARIEESTTPDFVEVRAIYEGADNATTLSGRADGVYYYRLVQRGAEPGVRASVVSVTVQHHPLSRALTFFVIGLVVFVSTVAVIVQGNARDARG